jgi:hypothetical protein
LWRTIAATTLKSPHEYSNAAFRLLEHAAADEARCIAIIDAPQTQASDASSADKSGESSAGESSTGERAGQSEPRFPAFGTATFVCSGRET